MPFLVKRPSGGSTQTEDDTYQPSLAFLSLAIDAFETRVRLPAAKGSTQAQATLSARAVALTTEVNPHGNASLLYTTLTSRQIECSVSGT